MDYNDQRERIAEAELLLKLHETFSLSVHFEHRAIAKRLSVLFDLPLKEASPATKAQENPEG